MANRTKSANQSSPKPFSYLTPSVGIVLIVFGLFFFGPLVVIGAIVGVMGLIIQAQHNRLAMTILKVLGAIIVLAMVIAVLRVTIKDVKRYK